MSSFFIFIHIPIFMNIQPIKPIVFFFFFKSESEFSSPFFSVLNYSLNSDPDMMKVKGLPKNFHNQFASWPRVQIIIYLTTVRLCLDGGIVEI